MARPKKPGVDYFPLDCIMDNKIRLIEAEFGLKGFAIIIKLFQKIYGGHGYFCDWNEEEALLFSRECGADFEEIRAIIEASLKRGIFSEKIFKKHKILTSVGVQRRYFEITSRRKNVKAELELLLLDCESLPIAVDINRVNVDINSKNAYRSTQSKVKESKVKESKVNKVSDEIKNEWNEYIEMRKKIKKPMTEKAAQLALKKLENLTSDREEQKLILEQSIFNSWQGLFPLKDKKAGGEKNDWQNFKPSR